MAEQATRLTRRDNENYYHNRMIICLCLGVSEKQIRTCIAEGACSVEAVGNACGAGTGCGTCQRTIAGLVAESAPTPRHTPPLEATLPRLATSPT